TTHLTATITDGTNVTYAWDLGDGTLATGATVTHTYPATGTYTALVTAVNSAGSMTATTTIVITPQAVPSSRLLYLPLITTAPPFTPIFIGAAIQARPVLVRGEQFFETTITIPNTLPATGHFYLSTSPSALTPVIVDDKFLLTSDDTVYFTYLFSDGTPPQFATVEIPQTTLRALQGHTVTIAYQDVYGTLVRASEMWLIWIAAHND
ncbi:MAG: PKD domain-containing protein, partial [Anaerolinea sp.]|nr:PKD domain-containing protein [Anaerolinea sp.]